MRAPRRAAKMLKYKNTSSTPTKTKVSCIRVCPPGAAKTKTRTPEDLSGILYRNFKRYAYCVVPTVVLYLEDGPSAASLISRSVSRVRWQPPASACCSGSKRSCCCRKPSIDKPSSGACMCCRWGGCVKRGSDNDIVLGMRCGYKRAAVLLYPR